MVYITHYVCGTALRFNFLSASQFRRSHGLGWLMAQGQFWFERLRIGFYLPSAICDHNWEQRVPC